MPTSRAVVYCVIPGELAPKLHEPLRRHFAGDGTVRVVVERRAGERRRPAGARNSEPPDAERRIGERRALAVPVAVPVLPRRARPYVSRLLFSQLMEPSDRDAEDLDTARLVARVQDGQRDLFAVLYMRYFDRVYSYLRMVIGDVHEAEDLTQTVFVKIMEALPRYERRRQPFRAWLFVVVRNEAVSHLRARGRARVDLEDPSELARLRIADPAPEPSLGALDWISDDELMLFVERLPAVQRQVLLMRHMLDLNNVEIAAILGRTPNGVAVLHRRALAFLRERLTAIGREPKQRTTPRMRRWGRQAPVLRNRRWALR
jgi:RNA polymerase sigma-70 factor (ECF subfamily)